MINLPKYQKSRGLQCRLEWEEGRMGFNLLEWRLWKDMVEGFTLGDKNSWSSIWKHGEAGQNSKKSFLSQMSPYIPGGVTSSENLSSPPEKSTQSLVCSWKLGLWHVLPAPPCGLDCVASLPCTCSQSSSVHSWFSNLSGCVRTVKPEFSVQWVLAGHSCSCSWAWFSFIHNPVLNF